jgi:hypothetical protein
VAVELVKDRANAVTYWPEVRPASATLTFVDEGGSTVETPAVTLVSIGAAGTATVSAVTSQVVVRLDDVTNIAVDDYLWLASQDGWGCAVRVSEVDSTTITLESAPAGTVQVSDTLHGLKLTATIASGSVDTASTRYRLEWVVTDTDAVLHEHRQAAWVVRQLFRDPVSPADASRYVQMQFPGVAAGEDFGRWRRLGERASMRVKQKLVAAGDFPSLLGDDSAFTFAGVTALRIELAHEGLVPGGYDPDAYIEAQEAQLGRQIREARANLWVDRDQDDAVDADEVRSLFTIRAVRA